MSYLRNSGGSYHGQDDDVHFMIGSRHHRFRITAMPCVPQRDNLSEKTFNIFNRPSRSWVWGNTELINQAGSFGEGWTAFAGDPDCVAELIKTVVDQATQEAAKRVDNDQHIGTFGVGWWKGDTHDLVVIQAIRGGTPLAPAKFLEEHTMDLIRQLRQLSGTEQLMDGASDTFWELLEIANTTQDPHEAHGFFDLGWRLIPATQRDRIISGGPLGGALGAWYTRLRLSRNNDVDEPSTQDRKL